MKKIETQNQALEVYPWLMTCKNVENEGYDFYFQRIKYKCNTEKSNTFVFVVTRSAKTKAGSKMYSNMPIMAFYDKETANKYIDCMKQRGIDDEVKYRFAIVDFHKLNTSYDL